MSRSMIVLSFCLVWLSTGVALGQAKAKPAPPMNKPAAKAVWHWGNGSTTDVKFKTAKQAAAYTAARQIETVMGTRQPNSERLTSRFTPPVSPFQLKSAGISSVKGRAVRHQVATRALGDNGKPLAKVRVSVLRLKDGTYKAWDNGAYHRVRVNVGGTYIPMRDRVDPRETMRPPPVIKKTVP